MFFAVSVVLINSLSCALVFLSVFCQKHGIFYWYFRENFDSVIFLRPWWQPAKAEEVVKIIDKYDKIVKALDEKQRLLEESQKEKQSLLKLEEKESVEDAPGKVKEVVKSTENFYKIVKALKEPRRLLEEKKGRYVPNMLELWRGIQPESSAL